MRTSILHSVFCRFDSLHRWLSRYVVERQLRKVGAGNVNQILTDTTITELHILYRLAQGCPPNARILEIGSYLGASTCYLAAGVARNNGTVFCVDTWQNETMTDGLRDTFAEFSANTRGIQSFLQIIRKRSEQLDDTDLTLPVDLVFIDADHSYLAVKEDFERVSGWLTPIGVVVFHDSRSHPGVSRVIGEALESSKWVMIGCTENLSWIRPAPVSWQANQIMGSVSR